MELPVGYQNFWIAVLLGIPVALTFLAWDCQSYMVRMIKRKSGYVILPWIILILTLGFLSTVPFLNFEMMPLVAPWQTVSTVAFSVSLFIQLYWNWKTFKK